MQTQDAPAELLFKLWPWLEANRNRIIGVVVAIVVLAGIVFFYNTQQEQKEIDAGEAMTKLLLSDAGTLNQSADALTQLAAKYNGTQTAKRATLQAGASMFDVGRYADAQAQFQKFLETAPTGPMAATAQLGIAACLEAQGKTDEAIAAYKRTVAGYPRTASELQADYALGRIAESQGRLNDAMSSYQAVLQGGMNDTLGQAAYERLMTIKSEQAEKGVAALQRASAPATAPAITKPAAAPAPSAKPNLLLPAK